jgi:hypothetical protein
MKLANLVVDAERGEGSAASLMQANGFDIQTA